MEISYIIPLIISVVIGYFIGWLQFRRKETPTADTLLTNNDDIEISNRRLSQVRKVLKRRFEDIDKNELRDIFNIVREIDLEVGSVSFKSTSGINVETTGGQFIDWESEGKMMVERFTSDFANEPDPTKYILWSKDNLGWKVDAHKLSKLMNDMEEQPDQILFEIARREEKEQIVETLVISAIKKTLDTSGGQSAFTRILRRKAVSDTGKSISGNNVLEYVDPCRRCP